ncbi:major facilitator superfamily domain-containing protein [Dunaliella salina]|uniref:Major facilitator superfamily domain-containing protein n=1 Tax=Dunaliella salina TaxID=3046 RepID=A0ABQ7GDZ4_DUNSA|nr:major facilitator superfamily domain-containing protein [Dunaliella salina]|eukprot:KAF5832833.1 major facilitator superfamily domain-containing protein [Dunaliella salina]
MNFLKYPIPIMRVLQTPNLGGQVRPSFARPFSTRILLSSTKLPLAPQHHHHVHTAASLVGAGPLEEKKSSWKPIVAITAVAMLTCNLHRSVFTMLLPDISAHHLLTLKDVGVMNSAMLGGYLAGQIPAGFLSDMLGGERVLLVGLLLWSLATASTGLMPTRAGLIASRIAMGLFSACAMPATSAMAARWVPPQVKASTLATVYMLFNMGGVLGLVATPFIAQVCGFSSTFMATGLAGALWAVGSWLYLPQNGPESHGLKGRTSSSSSIDNTSSSSSSSSSIDNTSSSSSSNGGGSSSSDASNSRGSGSNIGNEGSVAASGLLQASGFGENGASSSNSSDYGQLSGSNGGGGMVSSLGTTHVVEGRVGSSDGVSSSNSNSSSNSSSDSSNGSSSSSNGSNSNGSSSSSSNGQGDSSYGQLVSKSSSASGSTHGSAPCPEWNGASSPAQTGAVRVSAATVVETQPSLMQQQQQQQQQHLERAFHAEYPGQSLYTNGGGLCTDAHAEQKTSNTPQQALKLQHEQQQQHEHEQQQQQSMGEAQPHSVQPLKPKGPPVLAQILVLCWAHAVMGWGFFIFQSWIPLYLRPPPSLSPCAIKSNLHHMLPMFLFPSYSWIPLD